MVQPNKLKGKLKLKQLKTNLVVDEDVVRSLESGLMLKRGMGNFYGLEDEFVAKIVEALRDEEHESVTVSLLVPIEKAKKRKPK